MAKVSDAHTLQMIETAKVSNAHALPIIGAAKATPATPLPMLTNKPQIWNSIVPHIRLILLDDITNKWNQPIPINHYSLVINSSNIRKWIKEGKK